MPAQYELTYHNQFKKDFKKLVKGNLLDVIETGNVIGQLQRGEKLLAKYVDHALTSNWHGFRDCHIKPDLVLIYRTQNQELQLARIGSHAELFN